MTEFAEENPFPNLRAPGADYALEWEAVTTPERSVDEGASPLDDHGLTAADRVALGLTPLDPRALHGSTEGDAKGVLRRAFQ